MTPERLGFVTLQVGDRAVPLRFTWAAIDELGSNGVTLLITKAQSGEAGAPGALADLIVAASAGAVERDALMADPPGWETAFETVVEAWLLALHGPTRKAAEGGDASGPSMTQPTGWRRLLAPLSRLGRMSPPSTSPHPT